MPAHQKIESKRVIKSLIITTEGTSTEKGILEKGIGIKGFFKKGSGKRGFSKIPYLGTFQKSLNSDPCV